MPANLTSKKANLVSRLQALSQQQIDLLGQVRDLAFEFTDNDFQANGTNAIIDVDLQTGQSGGPAPFPYLTAANINQAFAAFQDIDSTLAANSRQDYKRLRAMKA